MLLLSKQHLPHSAFIPRTHHLALAQSSLLLGCTPMRMFATKKTESSSFFNSKPDGLNYFKWEQMKKDFTN